MQYNRVYAIVECLSEKEIKQLVQLANNELSLIQQKLFHYIIKKIKEKGNLDESEVVLLKIYKQKYTATKDAILRNDYAVIAKFISNYIVTQAIVNNHNKNNKNYQYELVVSILNRKAYTLFEKEILKIIDEIVANEDYENFNRFFNLFVNYKITIAKNDTHTFRETYKYILHYKETIEKMVANYILNYNILIHHVNLCINIYDKEFIGEPMPISDDLNKTIENSDLLYYKLSKINSYQKDIKKSIQYSLEKLALLSKIENYYTIDYKKERTSSYFNLFTYYSLLGDFGEASKVGENLMKIFKEDNQKYNSSQIASFVLNYISTLFRTLEIEKAVSFFNEYEEIINQHNQGNRVIMYRIFMFLFNKNIDKAYSTLAQLEPVEDAFDKILIKIIESIVYYGRKDHELALNNLSNIMQSIYYNKIKEDIGYKYFVNYFKQLILIDLSIVQKDKNAKITQLKDNIDQVFNELIKSNTAYMFPIVWLKFELQN